MQRFIRDVRSAIIAACTWRMHRDRTASLMGLKLRGRLGAPRQRPCAAPATVCLLPSSRSFQK